MFTASPEANPLITRALIVLPSPLMLKALTAPARLPLMTTSGPFGLVSPPKAVCDVPSMVIGVVIVGKAEVGLMVKTPPEKFGSVFGILKLIVFASLEKFA